MTKIEQAKLINNTTDLIIIYEAESYLEQEILAQKYLNLNNKLQKISDKKSKEIFGEDNITRSDRYMLKYTEEMKKIKNYYQKDMFENNLELVHLSKSFLPLMMKPRIPNNKLTFNKIENNNIPRCCFSNSIFGALAAIEVGKCGDELYVHVPINPQKIISNEDVKNYVPDAINTGEVWILDEQLITNVAGKIIVGKSYGITEKYYINNQDIQYTYFYDYIFYPNELDNRIENIINSI